MEDRERIEAHCATEGLKIVGWRDDAVDGVTALLGRWVVITDDYEDQGLYLEDEGELSAVVVGAAEYHNQRVHIGFKPDGTDAADEVPDMSALDPID